MSTVFHVGDTVKIKRIIRFSPAVTIGMQGNIIGIYHRLGEHIDVCVSLPSIRKNYWWLCTPEELELVQEESK